jgi:hypothetical protein
MNRIRWRKQIWRERSILSDPKLNWSNEKAERHAVMRVHSSGRLGSALAKAAITLAWVDLAEYLHFRLGLPGVLLGRL